MTPVPDSGVSWLEQRLSISLDPIDRALARLGVDINHSSASGIDVEVYDQDTRQRVPAAVVIRRGQRRFRASLMTAYGGRCAITGTALPAILEAAHISPYRGDHTDAVANGMLLRADIHTLFDLYLLTLTFDEDDGYQVRVAPDAAVEPYRNLEGGQLPPVTTAPWSPPEPRLLKRHHEKCLWLT